MSSPIAPVVDGTAQPDNALRAQLGFGLEAYSPRRSMLLRALAGARLSVDQLGMGLKLGLHRHQIVRGIELALLDHRKEMAEKALQGFEK